MAQCRLGGFTLASFFYHSARSQDPGQRRILDRATRQRRLNRQLEALENDNFQDDPHANMPQLVKRLPQFDDDAETGDFCAVALCLLSSFFSWHAPCVKHSSLPRSLV